MSDDVKELIERVRGGVEASGWACDALDPRHVLNLLAHIDGEPVRQAAAVAAAREEQREADRLWTLRVGFEFVSRSSPKEPFGAADMSRFEACMRAVTSTPLTSTPLADRSAALEERMNVVLHAGPSTALAVSVFDRAEKAEARVAELEADLSRVAANRGELVVAVSETVAERDALRAQVEAARAVANRVESARGSMFAARDVAGDILTAMDGAKPSQGG